MINNDILVSTIAEMEAAIMSNVLCMIMFV
jgi:hypothetical protein